MDVLRIINIDLEDFKVCERDKFEDFKLSQSCAICFKTIIAFPLNNLIFEDQKLQDILTNITSCFNSEKLWEKSEPTVSSCHVCLQQLLVSHLFQQKAQKGYDLLKKSLEWSENEKLKEVLPKVEVPSPKVQNKRRNRKSVKVVIEPDPSELNDFSDIDHWDDDIPNNSDSDFCNDKDDFDDDFEPIEKKADVSKKKGKIKKENGDNTGNTKKKRLKTDNKTCPLCKKVFKKSYVLRNHISAVHKREALHQCEVCLKRFSWIKNLRRHKLIHTGERPYICDKCGKGFIQKQQLIDHDPVHTGEKLTCGVCGKQSKTISGLNRHMKSIHTEGSSVCDICGKILSSKVALKGHMLTHGEKQFTCDRCDRKFTSKVLMQSHQRMHTGEKPFTCKECGESFRSSTGLRLHKLVHTGEKPHACHLCPKTFRRSQHLKYHIRVHLGLKEFSCDVCGKCFLTNGNLTAHKKIHTDTRPFVCELCGKAFTTPSNLRKHKSIHQQSAAAS